MTVPRETLAKNCSKCGVNPRRNDHAWCLGCWAAYQRAWRKRQTILARDLRNLVKKHDRSHETQ